MSLHLTIFRSLDITRISICSFQGTSCVLQDIQCPDQSPQDPILPLPVSQSPGREPFFYKGGIHLLSRAVSSKVPSAVHGLTIVFGMGTGVSHERIDTTCFSVITAMCSQHRQLNNKTIPTSSSLERR